MHRLLAVSLLLVATPVFAQAERDRYDLGRRAHAFEVAWDATAEDPAAHKRAIPFVDQAVKHFVGLNLAAGAADLDAARHALESADAVPPAVRWADSLQILPETYVIDAAAADVVVIVKPCYKPGVDPPKGPVVRARLGTGKAVEAPLDSLPATVRVPAKDVPGPPSADFKLTAEVVAVGKELCTRVVGVSRVEKLKDRLGAVQHAAAELPDPPKTIEQATFALLVKTLGHLANKQAPETDLPTSRLIAGAERLSNLTEPYYVPKRSGEFWLSIPTGKNSTVVRIRIPPKLDERKDKVPVVVALHGLGGSENVYFDGYGNGIVARLASERGWIVVAPRVEGLLGTPPPPAVPALLDELARRYPIDPKRVYLVGHSMGARHALQLAEEHPERYAAVAVLGGGRVNKPEALTSVRIFVGCGKLDSALEKARPLAKSLEAAKCPVTLKEYDDVEHLMIVREASADVFKFFESR
jgi:pimeloyl-ACP methyl ester carboxylesterase